MNVAAFGAQAERYAAALTGIDAVIAVPERMVEAYFEAVRRRETGRPFYGMLLFDEPRTRTLELLAPSVLEKWPGFDERRWVLDHYGSGEGLVNGKPARDAFTEMDPSLRQGAVEFLLLCDAVLVRSHAEYARINALAPRPRPYERIVAVPQLETLSRVTPQRPSVVVWAPERPAETSALYAFALSEFRGDVTFVVGDGVPPSGLPGRFVHAGDPQVSAALAAATAVIATDGADPGAAIAFAQRGYGVAAPLTSGAHEYVRDLVTYDPGTPRTLQVAAAMAICRPASVRERPPIPPALAPPAVPPRADAPLITCVVPTYNRRDDLARCLECIAAQTYPNVEALVVNDAGEAVDDIVARHSFARLLNLEQNVGNMRALAAGTQAAKGAFIGWLADDDWLYPDHFARLFAALATSSASIAHTNGVIRYQRRRDDRTLETIGFNAGVFFDTTTPSDALIATGIVVISALFRREIFDVIEPQLNIGVPDHEFQLRAADRFVFAYTEHATVEWRVRRGESFYAKQDLPAGMRHVFEVLHPRTDRPMIEENRRSTIENVAKRPPDDYIFPPTVWVGPQPPSV